MSNGNGNGNGSGGGWAWFWVILVIAVIGVSYFRQRENGKVSGPGGVVASTKRPEPQNPLVINKFGWDIGAVSHDLLVTNESGSNLSGIQVVVW